MATRTPGPFEASGLAYTSSRSAVASPAAESRRGVPLVEIDATLYDDEASAQRAAAVVAPLAPPPIAPPPARVALAVPPSPRIMAPRRGLTRGQRRTIVSSVVGAGSVALLTIGVAWGFTRLPVRGDVAFPAGDPVQDAPPVSVAIAAGVPAALQATAPSVAQPARSARVSRSVAPRAIFADPAIRARSAVLPPPRRASTPTGSPVGIPVSTTAAQSCGQRCGTNVQCMLACRPQGLGAHANPLVGDQPTREQVVQAMDSVRGPVLMCGISLPPTAPRMASVTVSFDPSGHATWASVAAPLQNTPAGDCIVRAVERARVPAFERGPFVVHYPLAAR
ncbi:MAG: hypothetical protein WCJ30_04420 [Deltaproteobacteria bacterium]